MSPEYFFNHKSADNILRLKLGGDHLYYAIGLNMNDMTWDPELREVTLPWVPSSVQQGRDNVIHGGVTALYLDTVCGFAANRLIEKPDHIAVTAELSIHYFSPVQAGSSLLIKAQVSQREGKTMFVTARIVSASDRETNIVEAHVRMVETRDSKLEDNF